MHLLLVTPARMRLAEGGGGEPSTGHKRDEERGGGLAHHRGRDDAHDAQMNTVTVTMATSSRCELTAAPERGAMTVFRERSTPTMKSPPL